MKKTTIAVIVLDALVVACFIAIYAIPFVKHTLITTAYATKTHQWIAHVFYSEATINRILASDSYIPLTDDVDFGAIVIDTSPRDTFENEWDEQILRRDPGNDYFKRIDVRVGNHDAFLVAIYDPSKVTLIHSEHFNTGSGQEQIITMCARYRGRVCINGGMFVDHGMGSDIPQGYLIANGRLIWSDNNRPSNIIGMNNDNKLMLFTGTGTEAIERGMRDGLEFGPFLIVNGEPLRFTDESSAGGFSRAARVAIAQRRDGIILFLVTNGTHAFGPNLGEVIEVLQRYGAWNAANLDGGTSSQLVIDGQLINDPRNIFGQSVFNGRAVVSGFGFIP